MATETVNTHELRTGDIVLHYDMRIELGERNERFDPSTGRTVVWFYGRITNPDEVRAALIPVSWRTSDRHPEFARGTFWQVQGNDLALWRREI